MKTHYYLSLFLLACFSFSAAAQGGFFGKKTVISIDGSLRGTLIYNRVLPDFDYNNGNFGGKTSSHFIATGFSASLSHYFSKRIGVGIDVNMTFNYIKTPNAFWGSYYDYNLGTYTSAEVTVEKMRMKTIYIIPKFEWSSNGNLPVGVSHSIGVGYAGSSVVDRVYQKSEKSTDYYDQGTASKSTIKGSSIKPIHGMVVEYGVKIRFPITSFMTLNLGSNLRIHLPGPGYIISGGADTSTLDGQIQRSMRNSRGANLMDIRAGLAFVLF